METYLRICFGYDPIIQSYQKHALKQGNLFNFFFPIITIYHGKEIGQSNRHQKKSNGLHYILSFVIHITNDSKDQGRSILFWTFWFKNSIQGNLNLQNACLSFYKLHIFFLPF